MSPKASFTGGPGTTVGRYEIVTKLFESELGTMSAARIGSGEGAGKIVALRVAEGPNEATEQLAAIAKKVSKLGSDHVVAVLDVVEGEKKLGVVSEYVEGESLSTLLRVASVRRSAVPTPVAVRMALDLLDALEFVHGQEDKLGDSADSRFGGLLPGAVLVGVDGKARLLEIGVMGFASRTEPWGKDPKRVAYAAPESLKKGEPIAAAADVFAAGVLLWEMLQNKRLFGGLSYAAVSAKVLEQKIGRADAGRAAGSAPLSSALADVVVKALDRDPAKRYGSAQELADAIRGAGDAVASPEDVAALVEQLAGRTIAGYRNSIAKAAAAPLGAPIAEPAGKASDKGDAARKPAEAKKPAPRTADAAAAPSEEPGEEAKDGKKLPPPKAGAGSGPGKPAQKKPEKPARPDASPSASDDMDIVVDDGAEASVDDAEAEELLAAEAEQAAQSPELEKADEPAAEAEAGAEAKAEPAAEAKAEPTADKEAPKPTEEAKAEGKDDKAPPPPPPPPPKPELADKPEEAKKLAAELAAASAQDKPRPAEASAAKPEEPDDKPLPAAVPATAALASEPLSDAAILPSQDEDLAQPKRRGLLFAVVGTVLVIGIGLVAYTQLTGGSNASPPSSATASATSNAALPPPSSQPTAAATTTATAAPTAAATGTATAEPSATATAAADATAAPTASVKAMGKAPPPPPGGRQPGPGKGKLPSKRYMPGDL